jgi:hypothetical protein
MRLRARSLTQLKYAGFRDDATWEGSVRHCAPSSVTVCLSLFRYHVWFVGVAEE